MVREVIVNLFEEMSKFPKVVDIIVVKSIFQFLHYILVCSVKIELKTLFYKILYEEYF